jgi:Gram-negative bacterial TonB protein C-terminal
MFVAAMIGCVSSSAHAGPADPVRYTRAGHWEINYDRDSCHLQARFGTDDGVQYASFTRYQPVSADAPGGMELALYGKRLDVSGGRRDTALDFGVGKPLKVTALTGTQGEFHMAIFRFVGYAQRKSSDTPVMNDAIESRVTGLTVKMYAKPAFHLEFGSLTKPMAAMQACTENLVKSWGFDPKVQATLKERPAPRNSPATWLSGDDYPDKALRAGAAGLVQFRLSVEADGSVSGCYILARTEPDVFATPTCRAMMRKARFKPAIDAAGNPVASYFVSSVLYNLVR